MLDGNRIRALPVSLSSLTKLEVLRLSANEIDSVPGKLLLLPRLKTLDVSHNPVRHIPLRITEAKALQWFNIGNANISYEEYKRIRRRLNKRIDIPHSQPVFFEDDERPCYTERNDLPDLKIFTKVEIEASYWGGWQQWQTFLQANVNKRELSTLADSSIAVKDSVTLRFIVGERGGISNIEVVHSGNGQTKKEAVRLLKLSCRYWVPAENGSRIINAWTQQTFVFEKTGEGANAAVSVRAFNPFPAPLNTLTREE